MIKRAKLPPVLGRPTLGQREGVASIFEGDALPDESEDEIYLDSWCSGPEGEQGRGNV